jgi:hypothetical protein
MIIETVWFEKVNNVESVEPTWPSILNSEIIPLGVTSSAIIWL